MGSCAREGEDACGQQTWVVGTTPTVPNTTWCLINSSTNAFFYYFVGVNFKETTCQSFAREPASDRSLWVAEAFCLCWTLACSHPNLYQQTFSACGLTMAVCSLWPKPPAVPTCTKRRLFICWSAVSGPAAVPGGLLWVETDQICTWEGKTVNDSTQNSSSQPRLFTAFFFLEKYLFVSLLYV